MEYHLIIPWQYWISWQGRWSTKCCASLCARATI